MAKKKLSNLPSQNASEKQCNTRSLVIPFRVSVKEWKLLLKKCGGKGKLSAFIREKLGLGIDE